MLSVTMVCVPVRVKQIYRYEEHTVNTGEVWVLDGLRVTNLDVPINRTTIKRDLFCLPGIEPKCICMVSF